MLKDSKELIYLIKNGSESDVIKLIDSCNKFNRLCSLACRALMERGNTELILRYTERFQLWSNNEAELIRRGNAQEISAYIKKWQMFRPGEEALIERGDSTEIVSYMVRHLFKPTSLVKLVERGNLQEIKIASQLISFGPLAETALIKKGNHELIMVYLRIHPLFSAKEEQLLIKRGNLAEISFYESQYGFH